MTNGFCENLMKEAYLLKDSWDALPLDRARISCTLGNLDNAMGNDCSCNRCPPIKGNPLLEGQKRVDAYRQEALAVSVRSQGWAIGKVAADFGA